MADSRPDAGSTSAGFILGFVLAVGGIFAATQAGVLDLVWVAEDTEVPAIPVTSTPAPPDVPSDFSTAYATVSSGVVRVETTRCDGVITGSGALVAPDLVLTAAHVVGGYASVQLLAGDQSATGRVVGYSTQDDLALVRASRPISGHVFRVVDQPPEVGNEVAAIGYPLSGPLSMAGPGIVSAYGEDVSYKIWDGSVVDVQDLMRTSIPTNQGNSGGPVVNVDGAVVGIVSGTRQSGGSVDDEGVVSLDVVDGIKYAVPAQRIQERLPQWMALGEDLALQACEAPPDLGPADLVTAKSVGPDTDAVIAVLFDYFDGINRGDYGRAYRQLSGARRDGTSLEQFTEQQASSYVTGVVILETRREGDHLRAVTTFASYQEAEFGPDNLECAYWNLDYRFVGGGEHGWSIQETTEVEGQPRFEACTV